MRLFTISFFLLAHALFPQSSSSFWDNMRATNETFVLKSGEKKIIKTDDFPEGTLEAVYRITVLDDNQKISGSLVSVLKAIPDPTGISQGAAGGVFLLSTISGEDKCKYVIFKSLADAEAYVKTGKRVRACLYQDTPVNKEIQRLSVHALCLEKNPRNLYFVFESDNLILKEKITFEMVPWVDYRLNSGWNPQTKKELLTTLDSFKWTKKLTKKDFFQASVLESITSQYNYYQFSKLLASERNNAIETAIQIALKKTGEAEKYYNAIREESLLLFNAGKTNEAIDLINIEMIGKNRATYKDFGVLGDYHLLTGQFSKAEGYYNEGLKRNPSEIRFQLNLAHVYLFTDRLPQAKEIHKKYHTENLSAGLSWAAQAKADFADFEKWGMSNKDFKKLIRIID